jgi:hypothetical protein
MLGEYKVPIRLTVDLIPAIDVTVYREGEAASALVATKVTASEVAEAEEETESAAESEAEEGTESTVETEAE